MIKKITMETTFNEKIKNLFRKHEELLSRANEPMEEGNGIFTRYKNPILTAAHTPVIWRYDLDEKSNPFLMERIGMNATLNSEQSNGTESICWWFVWKEQTVNRSLL